MSVYVCLGAPPASSRICFCWRCRAGVGGGDCVRLAEITPRLVTRQTSAHRSQVGCTNHMSKPPLARPLPDTSWKVSLVLACPRWHHQTGLPGIQVDEFQTPRVYLNQLGSLPLRWERGWWRGSEGKEGWRKCKKFIKCINYSEMWDLYADCFQRSEFVPPWEAMTWKRQTLEQENYDCVRTSELSCMSEPIVFST